MKQREMLSQGLSELLGYGCVRSVLPGDMAQGERGWSGAAVSRCRVTFGDGRVRPVIFKEADRKERVAMRALTEAGHRNTPAAFSLDLDAEEPRLMVQEDVGPVKRPPPDGDWIGEVARALAAIHADHRGADLPGIPHADRAYWLDFTTRISVNHFESRVRTDAEFAREFGGYLPRLREEASAFAERMAALYRERDCLTLTHGDLQTIDGDHIHYRQGRPYIIDFGFCAYAPFYIDLASFFDEDSARIYYEALIERGVPLEYGDFLKRYRIAFRYSGFAYLCPSVMNWRADDKATWKRLIQMVKIILTGAFPERRIDYSPALFEALLDEHAAGELDRR